MITATAHLKGVSPYSQSRVLQSKKKSKETDEAFEQRCWSERMHLTQNGNIFIPPMVFKNSLANAAKYAGIPIPGKGKEKYTKNFVSGVLVVEPLILPVKSDDVGHEWLFVPSNGQTGGSKRVYKCFPVIQQWEGDVQFLILDEIITKDVFKTVLTQAGMFIGIGRFRPQNNGYYGRFDVLNIDWQ